MLKISAFFEGLFMIIKVFFAVLVTIFLSIFGDLDYTGGQYGTHVGYSNHEQWWWVETYDECQNAIDQLESRRSTFDESVIFTYDGEAFDVKYCFVLEKNSFLKYGRNNPFKHKNEGVGIYAYIFFDDTSIDDFAYSYVHKYCAYYFYMNPEYIENGKYLDIDVDDLDVTFNPNVADSHWKNFICKSWDYKLKGTDEIVFSFFGGYEDKMIPLSDADIDAILDSVVVIGGDK